MKLLLILAVTAGLWAAPNSRPDFRKGGWKPLADLSLWHSLKPNDWQLCGDVRYDPATDPKKLACVASGPGQVMLNGPAGRTANFILNTDQGDAELYLEFMVPAKSNSGVYLQGLYEVQVLDSFGVAQPGVHDCGAIYERWINGKGEGGTPPRVNASKAPGEWQSYHIWFQAPRFDASGKKVANAKFLKVIHNGTVIHENVEAEGPTRSSLTLPEAARNPLMLQGDHGPVAYRNLYIRPLPKAK